MKELDPKYNESKFALYIGGLHAMKKEKPELSFDQLAEKAIADDPKDTSHIPNIKGALIWLKENGYEEQS